jgi:hypothetical protein
MKPMPYCWVVGWRGVGGEVGRSLEEEEFNMKGLRRFGACLMLGWQGRRGACCSNKQGT